MPHPEGKVISQNVPDNDAVICPQCAHQFEAIPINVQCQMNVLLEERARYANQDGTLPTKSEEKMTFPPTQIEQVYDFNEARGFPFNPPAHLPSEKVADFVRDSLNEEMTELEESIVERDLVKLVDSIVDLTYFAFGHLHRLGLTRQQAIACFNAVHTANMTKQRGKTAARKDFEDDAMKPADFVPPDETIREILFGSSVEGGAGEDAAGG